MKTLILISPHDDSKVDYSDFRDEVFKLMLDEKFEVPKVIRIFKEDGYAYKMSKMFQNLEVQEFESYPKKHGEGAERMRLDSMCIEADGAIIIRPEGGGEDFIITYLKNKLGGNAITKQI